MFCSNCGNKLDPSDVFCQKCGAKVAASTIPTQNVASVPAQQAKPTTNQTLTPEEIERRKAVREANAKREKIILLIVVGFIVFSCFVSCMSSLFGGDKEKSLDVTASPSVQANTASIPEPTPKEEDIMGLLYSLEIYDIKEMSAMLDVTENLGEELPKAVSVKRVFGEESSKSGTFEFYDGAGKRVAHVCIENGILNQLYVDDDLVFNAGDYSGEAKLDQDDRYHSNGTVEGELPEVDSDIVEKLTAAGYTVEHATQMQQILNTVGITSIEIYGASGAGTAESGLYAMTCYANGSTESKSRFTMTTEDGVVFYIGFLDEDLYDTDQGGFLKKYTDVHIPETEVDWDTYYTLQELAIEEVKGCLNYPNTADFKELSWGIGRSDENYKIVGKVSAKNGFGVKDDIYFAVWFVDQNGAFVVEGVTLNGSRVK